MLLGIFAKKQTHCFGYTDTFSPKCSLTIIPPCMNKKGIICAEKETNYIL